MEFPYHKMEERKKEWKNDVCKMLWTDGITTAFFVQLDRFKIAFSKSEEIFFFNWSIFFKMNGKNISWSIGHLM